MLEARVLGQLSLMQSVVSSLPDEKTIFSFVCHGLLDVPGVATARYTESAQEQVDASTVRIPLLVGETHRGELLFALSDPQAFAPYLDYLNNFCFMLAVILEERSQRRQNLLFQSKLEDRVRERTRQLLKTNAEREEIEKSLRASEAQLSNALMIAHLGPWTYDVINDLFTFDDHFYAMLRTTAAQVGGYTMSSAEYARRFVHPDDLGLVGGEIRKAIETDDPGYTCELSHRVLFGDGATGYVQVRIYILKDATGLTIRTYGVNQDITARVRSTEERTRLEDQIRQYQKVEAIGRLAGGVAHDFNTLTAIVLGYGEMLLGELPPEDPRRRYAEQILEAGRRSAALTRQLLAFSRKQTLQPEVLDLNDLLRNFKSMLGRLLGEGIELAFKLDPGTGCVRADPGQIEQVVTNLAINARDAMPLGGRLTIETAVVELDKAGAPGHGGVFPGTYVRLSLADTGSGIDKATMDRLFEPFFTTKPMGKGTGLGLATAYGIVKQSGWYIWASSEPDQGTTFTICLPRTDARPEVKAVVVVDGGELPRGSGQKVLLVEDEASMRELCTTLLVRLGYTVTAAKNGLEALLLVQERGLEPELVVTDVIMPAMSGAEMAKRLRRDRPDLRVLYMSGYPDEAIAPHGVLDPGTPFIQKPFSESDLARKISKALGTRAAAPRPGKRVLMIDDDGQYRELVRLFCEKAGHRFTGADSAAAARAALAAESFDVLLVDLNIPGTDGAQVLREIRAAGCVAPAIVLTGAVASADMEVLRPLGVTTVLEKSSTAEPLLRAIAAES